MERRIFNKHLVLRLIDYLGEVLKLARIRLKGNFPTDRFTIEMKGKVNDELSWFCVILVTGNDELAQTFREDFHNWAKIMNLNTVN